MWEEASRQLIRALRGARSQLALSRRLGYRSNPVREWEAGRRFPTTAETLRLAALVGVDLESSMARFHQACSPLLFENAVVDDESVARWLSALRGSVSVAELARRSQRSRYAISRWLSGETKPRLPMLLELLEAISGSASAFVSELVDIEQVPELSVLHNKKLATRELAFDEPWSEAVMRILETAEYRSLGCHKLGWIGKRLGLDDETEERCLSKMVQAGIIGLEDERFVQVAPMSIDTGSSAERVLALKQHWASVGLSRLSAPRPKDLFAYNAISLSEKDLDTVRRLLQDTYREIRSIVASSESEEVAALVQLQLVDWG